MPRNITIKNNNLLLELAPNLGAGVTRFVYVDDKNNRRDIFQPFLKEADKDFIHKKYTSPHLEFNLSHILMLPWCNRISTNLTNGFNYLGVFYPLPENIKGEPPIHGSAFQLQWQVLWQNQSEVVLTLLSETPKPYKYYAQLKFKLVKQTLMCELFFQNLADLPLPFGNGWHPWFVRTPAMKIQAKADSFWEVDKKSMPQKCCPLPSKLNFNNPQIIPDCYIDNAFSGWDGRANLIYSDGIVVQINTSNNLPLYHIYTPAEDAPFICFEPISHTPNFLGLQENPEHKQHLIPMQILQAQEFAYSYMNIEIVNNE